MHPGRLWPGPVAEEDIRAWRAAHPGRPRYAGLFAAVLAHVRAHPLSALATFAWAPPGAAALRPAARGGCAGRPASCCRWLVLPLHAVALHVPLHAEPRYFFPFLPAFSCSPPRAWPVAARPPPEA